MGQHRAQREVGLAVRRELGPDVGDRSSGSSSPRSIRRLAQTAVAPFVVEKTSASVSSVQGRPLGDVGDPGPDVHDRPPVDVDAAGRADVAASFEVGAQRVRDTTEPRLDETVDHRRESRETAR